MPVLIPFRVTARKPWTLASAVVLAAFSAASAACGLQLSTGIEAKSTWTRTYKVGDTATLELREPNGRINVEAVDGNEIHVVATRIAKGPTEEDAKAAVEKIEIKESASAERVEIDSTPAMSIRFHNSRRVDYDVKIPRNVNLTIKATNGSIEVKALRGLVKIEASNGEIKGTGLEGGTDVTATNGQIYLEMAKIAAGGIRCKTTNGEIVVTLPKSAKATVAARVTNGAIDVENLPISRDGESHRRLDADLGGGGPEVRLDTTNGMIRILGKD